MRIAKGEGRPVVWGWAVGVPEGAHSECSQTTHPAVFWAPQHATSWANCLQRALPVLRPLSCRREGRSTGDLVHSAQSIMGSVEEGAGMLYAPEYRESPCSGRFSLTAPITKRRGSSSPKNSDHTKIS